ncbi:hypothetical protein [Streptomyces sp. NRRL S-15]|uniref:hypothetical protein n=1 Tax=Streptomyces sp. NRRL S-15 TaxID=1463886 RepID=UPI000A7D3670|nr:hypothetical protein [Streptomyces sp. NRRL S-15]
MLDDLLGLFGQSLPDMIGNISAGVIGAGATAAWEKFRNRDRRRDDPDEAPDGGPTIS